MNKVKVLIISNKLDFTTDYICLELKRRETSYLRINREDFDKYQIILDIDNTELKIKLNGDLYYFDDCSSNAIYYRAPIYLRDIYKPDIPEDEQLFRTQWTAFIRNLTLFENVTWLNNPIATFKAENKFLQLKYAKKVGFPCPKTSVTNTSEIDTMSIENYIVKSVDTAVLRIGEKEAFIYSNVVSGEEIKNANLSICPVILQEYIYPKIDVRVTVIGSEVYAVRIVKDNKGIDGDWRRMKDNVQFIPFEMPAKIKQACIDLVKSLDLAFGAIDLIESNEDYYFIEINPTGEWAWLVDSAGLKIYEGICHYLEGFYSNEE